MKDGLHGQHFPDNDAVIAAVKDCVHSADEHYTRASNKLLFFTEDNPLPMVRIMWENRVIYLDSRST